MEHKDFYDIGKERKALRHEVLGEAGVSAHELSKRGMQTPAEFDDAVVKGSLADVADKPIVSEEMKGKLLETLGRIAELTEEAKGFSFKNEAQRVAYEGAREDDRKRKVVAPERGNEFVSEAETKRQSIFHELDVMDEFLVKQKRGEYLATRHKNDPRLAERLRRNATLEATLAKRRMMLETDPETRLLVREHELDAYNRQLDVDHYVVTPSRREYIGRIETLINQRKPILLEGHTGTGKSELARIAARELSGNDPEVVYCNPQTRQSDIFGMQSLKETKRGATVTETDYGPLVRAITDGKLCLFDEFNELDPRGRQMLKYLYNVKPGYMVNVPGNGKVRVVEGFGIVMTANLKSDKYQAKGELEPQEARVFQDSTIRVDYPKADELYDIALSALSDTEGRVMLSHQEAETTLKHFIDAIVDIEEAYSKAIPAAYGKDGDFAMKGRKKRPALGKYVLDMGMVARLLQGFHIDRMKYGTPLREFIDASLIRTLEGNRVSEDDKKLAIFILAKHGFLRGEDALASIDLDYSDGRLNPNIFPKLAEVDLPPDASLKTLSAEEVAKLDPYGKWKISVEDALGEFGVEAPKVEPDSERCEVDFAEARELFKENFLGPEAIEKTFGFRLDAKEIPPIPFSKQELEQAQKLGQLLVLYWDTLPDKTPITGALIAEQFGTQQDGNKFFFNTKWYENESFFTTETPIRGWALVTPELVDGTLKQDYLQQAETLIVYLRNEAFAGKALPKIYEDAIKEFEGKKPEIKTLWQDYDNNWQKIAEILSKLAITDLTRESAIETWYRLKLGNASGQENFLETRHSWGKSRDSDGVFVDVGNFASRGASVGGHDPRNALGYLGASFSRRAV